MKWALEEKILIPRAGLPTRKTGHHFRRPAGLAAAGLASPLVRIDQEFLASGALVVDGDVGKLQRLLQRHYLRVVAGKRGLELGRDALAQPADFGGADLLQERRQEPAADAPGQAECTAELGRAIVEAAIDIDLLVHVRTVAAIFL